MNDRFEMFGQQICVVDTETTGLNPKEHELIEVCVLPLDMNCEPKTGIIPFHLTIRPEKAIAESAMSVNKKSLVKLMTEGFDKYRAADLFVEWFENLHLAPGKRIAPLGHNYIFDREFLIEWLGFKTYDYCFDYHYRDSMVALQYINDQASAHRKESPFRRVSLGNACQVFGIVNPDAHTAIGDCIATAQLYKSITEAGLFSF